MSTQHTPTPWRVTERDANGNYEIRESDENATIAKVVEYGVGPIHTPANAAFIARACNSHDALVEALLEIANADVDPAFWRVRVEHLRTVARAALAAAD